MEDEKALAHFAARLWNLGHKELVRECTPRFAAALEDRDQERKPSRQEWWSKFHKAMWLPSFGMLAFVWLLMTLMETYLGLSLGLSSHVLALIYWGFLITPLWLLISIRGAASPIDRNPSPSDERT